jgi:endogenous inhibitor of DNA gyrase (YacG/DUF329 family)
MSTKRVPGPLFKKKQQWSTSNPYRPFCSERCKQLDLGAWASEDYQIPANINVDEEDFSSSMVDLETWKSPTLH